MTQLSQLAASLNAGEWGQLSTTNFGLSFWNTGDPNTSHFFDYTRRIRWDAANGYMWVFGGSHPGYAIPRAVGRYIDSTNTWERIWTGETGASHGYSSCTFYPPAGRLWRAEDPGGYTIQVASFNGSGWSNEGGTQSYIGLPPYTAFEWFPDRGLFYQFSENGAPAGLYSFNPSTLTWADTGWTGCNDGTYHVWSQYLPVTGYLLFGGGNDCMHMWRMDSSGTISACTAPQYAHGMTTATVAACPVSGELLMLFSNEAFHAYNPVTDSWTTGLNNPYALAGVENRYSLAGAIDSYGVVMFCDASTNPGTVYLYKHAGGPAGPMLSQLERGRRGMGRGILVGV